jgi:hypothetical protein
VRRLESEMRLDLAVLAFTASSVFLRTQIFISNRFS